MATKETKTAAKRYIRTKGTRKRAVAIVRLTQHAGDLTVNGRPVNDYFPILDLQKQIQEPMRLLALTGKVGAVITTKGGGLRGQAEAVRHALSRALSQIQAEHRTALKRAGLLTRDAREKERKKFGLKRARKAPQWGKR